MRGRRGLSNSRERSRSPTPTFLDWLRARRLSRRESESWRERARKDRWRMWQYPRWSDEDSRSDMDEDVSVGEGGVGDQRSWMSGGGSNLAYIPYFPLPYSPSINLLSQTLPYPPFNPTPFPRGGDTTGLSVKKHRIPSLIMRENEEVGERPQPDTTSPVTLLPEEVMCELFSWLRLRELRRCAEVCHYWRKLSLHVEAHPPWGSPAWREVCLLSDLLSKRDSASSSDKYKGYFRVKEEEERVRGRRVVRVEQLMGEYNYFSLMEMKVRDPFLYQQVIERAAGCGGGGGCYRTMDLARRFPPQCTPSRAQLDTMSEVERMVWLLLVGEASVAAAQFRECARRERKVLRYWGELECVEEGLEAVPTPVYPCDDFAYQQAFKKFADDETSVDRNEKRKEKSEEEKKEEGRERKRRRLEQEKQIVEEEEEDEERDSEKMESDKSEHRNNSTRENQEREKEASAEEQEKNAEEAKEDDGDEDYEETLENCMRIELEERYREFLEDMKDRFVFGGDGATISYTDIDDNASLDPPTPEIHPCGCCEFEWNDGYNDAEVYLLKCTTFFFLVISNCFI